MRYKDTRVIAIYSAARVMWEAMQISPRYSDILDIAIGKVCTHSIVITQSCLYTLMKAGRLEGDNRVDAWLPLWDEHQSDATSICSFAFIEEFSMKCDSRRYRTLFVCFLLVL